MWSLLSFFKRKAKTEPVITPPKLSDEVSKKEDTHIQNIINHNNKVDTEPLFELDPKLSFELDLLLNPPKEIPYNPSQDIPFTKQSIQDAETRKEDDMNLVLPENIRNESIEVSKEKYFYLDDGRYFKSLSDLYKNIYSISDESFNRHIQNNDFINWLRDVFFDYEAYQLLLYAKTKERYSNLLKELLEERETKNRIPEQKEEKNKIKDELKKYYDMVENIVLISNQNIERINIKLSEMKETNKEVSEISDIKEKLNNLTLKIDKILNDSETNPQNKAMPINEEISKLNDGINVLFNQYSDKINLELSDIKKRNEYSSKLNEKLEELRLKLDKLSDDFDNIKQKLSKTPSKEELSELSNGLDLVLKISKKDKEEYDETLKEFKSIQNDINNLKNNLMLNQKNPSKKEFDEFKKTVKEQFDVKIKNYEAIIFRFERQTEILTNQNIHTLKKLKEEIDKSKKPDLSAISINAKTADFAKTDSIDIISRKVDKLEDENKHLKVLVELLEYNRDKISKNNDEKIQKLKDEIYNSIKSKEGNKANTELTLLKKQIHDEFSQKLKYFEDYNLRVKESLLLLEHQNISLRNKNDVDFKKLREEIYQKINNPEKNK